MNDRGADADISALNERYRDLSPLDHRPEGQRYRALLSDGTPVVVTALSRDVTDRFTDASAFDIALRMANAHHAEIFPRLLHVERGRGGLVHYAYGSRDVQPLDATPWKPRELAGLGAAIARGLHSVHTGGAIHGAVSTQRIGRVGAGAQLDDLGVFSALVAAGLSVTDAVFSLSTAPYVAPEVRDGTMPDPRSDVYSLGAALYELLTGKAPFGGRTTSFVMATVLSEESSSEMPVVGDAPSGPVVNAILRAIEENPADRWPDANAFADALSAGVSTPDAPVARVARTGCLPVAAATAVLATLTVAAVLRG